MIDITLQHLAWLEIVDDDRISYGYNQEWFNDEWRRLAGCGPTVATMMVSYMALKEERLLIETASDKMQALGRMNEVWDYVTPRFGGGLYKASWLASGVKQYMEEHQLPNQTKMISISPFLSRRPSVDVVQEFISHALVSDVPVAFLNRHKGRESSLWTWHWVLLVGICEVDGDIRCHILDEGEKREFSLSNWLQDTLLGGGFVYAY